VKKIVFSAFVVLSQHFTIAQVKINPADSGAYSLANLAQYFVGRGVKISNVTFTGNLKAFGQFNDVGSSVGLKKGIILTTGKAQEAEGPNNSRDITTDYYPGVRYDDPDLDILNNPNNVVDVAALEFDFIPISDTLKFRLVYGSDLYDRAQTDVNTNPLGIFFKPKTGTTFSNIATFSGVNGSTKISVQTINRGPDIEWGQVPTAVGINGGRYIYNTTFSPNIQYNGYTTPIEIKQVVNKCTEYRIKIAIGNSPATGADSGVLLEQANSNGGISSSVPISDADTIFLCDGDALPILTTNENSASHFEWYFNDIRVGNTTAILATIFSGEYKVKATISGSCLWSDSVHLKISPKFPLDLKANPALVCKDQLVTLSGTISSSVSGSNLEWSSVPAFPFIKNQFIQTVSVSGLSAKFMLSVTSKGGCTQSDSVTVVRNSAFFTLNPTPNDTICLNSSKTLKASREGIIARPASDTDPFSLLWKNTARTIVSTQTEFAITPKFSDTYQINLESENGCKDSAKVYVQVDSVSFARIKNRVICPNETIFITTSGLNLSSTVWGEIGKLGVISTDNFMSALPKTTTRYTLEIEAFNSRHFSPLTCKEKDTSEVTISPLPTYQKSKDIAVCRGNPVFIAVQNADNLLWSDANRLSNSFIYSALASKTFLFTVFSANKCEKTDSISVKLFPAFVNTITGKNEVCFGDSIRLSAKGANQHVWLNTAQISASINQLAVESLNFTLVGTNANQCKDSTIFPVKVNKVDVERSDFIVANQSGFICLDKKLNDTLFAPQNNFFAYEWKLGALTLSNPTNTNPVNKVGLYKLTITDAKNCKISDTILVKNKCKPDSIAPTDTIAVQFNIPNIFTPNGDGINDTFEISLLAPNSSIEIFNRWGATIFQSSNYDNSWNANGVVDGLYYFSLLSNAKKFNGWLQIAR